jgi:hypothetical protein
MVIMCLHPVCGKRRIGGGDANKSEDPVFHLVQGNASDAVMALLEAAKIRDGLAVAQSKNGLGALVRLGFAVVPLRLS